jgi:dihydrodipicolinate synthase/N-acetylneuraminate lyase
MLTAENIAGLYAIIPTPALPGAEQLGATGTVDLESTTALVEGLIRDGADGLIALGTTGECATLSEDDYRIFAAHLLEVVDGRIPTFIGTSALGGHQVADRLRFLAERGAAGTLLGLPMWQPVSTTMAVKFFREVSEAFPDMAVMVYANQRAFRYSYPLEFWEGVVDQAPTVVAAKYSRPKDLAALLEVTRGRINIVPNESTAAGFFEASPETTTALWATAAAMGPAPVAALMRAIQANDALRVAAISADIRSANEPVAPIFGDPEIFATYNLQMEKARINAAGYCECGRCRPPYDELPDPYLQAAQECGRRWALLHERYASVSAVGAGETE